MKSVTASRLRLIGRLLALALLVLLSAACSSHKAGAKSPELPVRHWLDEVPGVPVEYKSKLEAVVPNLYDPQKSFSFEDCVFLAIQQSPVLVHSAVEIEIKRLAQTSAVWKYIPEPRMTLSVSNNLTYYNMDQKDTPGDYGRTKPRVGLYAPFPNPVATHFEHQVQKLMSGIAISTHRKAIGEAIHKIGQSYLQLQAQQRILAVQKELLPLGKELVSYWRQVEAVEGKQGVKLNAAIQHDRELGLIVEQNTMQEVMLRTNLKILVGVEPQHRLAVEADSVDVLLAAFDGDRLQWEDRWTTGEDEQLLRKQIRLSDFNIMVAWAQYLPDMSLQINQTPPNGQYQPPAGQEDTFLHVVFDFPLIDWGRRYRDVQTARMHKAQAFHTLSRNRTTYSNEWLQARQRLALALTEFKLAQTRLETAELQHKEAKIAYAEGTIPLPALAEQEEAMVKARIASIVAERDLKLAKLGWMYLSNVLQEQFLGLPEKDEGN